MYAFNRYSFYNHNKLSMHLVKRCIPLRKYMCMLVHTHVCVHTHLWSGICGGWHQVSFSISSLYILRWGFSLNLEVCLEMGRLAINGGIPSPPALKLRTCTDRCCPHFTRDVRIQTKILLLGQEPFTDESSSQHPRNIFPMIIILKLTNIHMIYIYERLLYITVISQV